MRDQIFEGSEADWNGEAFAPGRWSSVRPPPVGARPALPWPALLQQAQDATWRAGDSSRAAEAAPQTPYGLTPEECEFLFIGGAGVGGPYLESFKQSFEDAGIRNVRVPRSRNTTFLDLALDAGSVPMINDLNYGDSLVSSPQIKAEAKRSRSLGREQYNLGGYSYGSAQAASLAYAIAQNGGRVDNLVLVGAPLNKDLYEAVTHHPNIKKVINVDLAPYGDPVRPGMDDWALTGTVPELWDQMHDNRGHFYYSAPGAVGDQRRESLAEDLVRRGVR